MSSKKIYFAGGKHRIESLDITVEEVMQLLSSGMSIDYICDHFPLLNEADIKACIVYSQKNIL
ncbi:DUF433 domain-containing protein [Deltaproteobacteria bacterium]|nr:DUF433 domain-containing protein [Deltaproteobacteria bacterium]